jgi:hypothetical protein
MDRNDGCAGGLAVEGEEERSSFFEKKKQKTFAPLVPRWCKQ